MGCLLGLSGLLALLGLHLLIRLIGPISRLFAGDAGGDGADGEADDDEEAHHGGDVGRVELNGIGGDGELGGVGAEFDKFAFLLGNAEQRAEQYAGHTAGKGDEPTLPQEDAPYYRGAGAEVEEGVHVIALLDYEHREGADDIKRRYDQDKTEHEEGDNFLNSDHAE